MTSEVNSIDHLFILCYIRKELIDFLLKVWILNKENMKFWDIDSYYY